MMDRVRAAIHSSPFVAAHRRVLPKGSDLQPETQSLKELHTLHMELHEARTQLRRLPLQRSAKESQQQVRVDELAAFRDELRTVRKRSDDRELDLKTGEQRVANLQAKMNQAGSNKEYDAIKGEIANVEATNDRVGDEVLELIGKQDEIQAAVDAADEAVTAGAAELAKLTEVIEYKLAKAKGRIELLEGQVAATESKLDPDSRAIYRRLLAGGTAGVDAIAAASGGTCQHCFTSLTPDRQAKLSAGKVAVCNSCTALLFPA